MPLVTLTFRRKSLPIAKQILFLNRLAKLLMKQYTMKQALEFMLYDPQLKNIAFSFFDFLQNGRSIDDCFKLTYFHPLVIAFMSFSKESGHISEHLMSCAQILKMKEDLENKLKRVSRYPLLLSIVSVFVFIGMNVYLLPVFTNTFESFGQTESLKSFELIINIFNYLFIGVMMVVAIVLVILLYVRRLEIEKKIKMIRQIPYLSNIYKLLVSMQLSYQIFAILDSGKTIREALQLLNEQNELKIVKHYARLLINQLAQGRSLFESFDVLELVQEDLKWLIKRSDQEGTLSQDLQTYSQLLIETIEHKAKQSILWVQPIFYLIMGVLIVAIYIFTLFPIYQLMQQI
ncbi:type II secretion system F family protein [Tenuibacillus multivorans]|uniref:Type II secretory pathway, component PulF n=1 Tax=Tenuibacillus multivorans TaxID=237069 RepID=A0A1G9ZBF0_9BACI|nr:type II secretion system F family protein [Tenuibacillus multivorans]GEL77344.1 hypothetical protein TMU01_15790 [Tenuibacillus multivorans]SDN17926.1 Type II secretory pathway, component PulF [Tenuibacillus multivorans]